MIIVDIHNETIDLTKITREYENYEMFFDKDHFSFSEIKQGCCFSKDLIVDFYTGFYFMFYPPQDIERTGLYYRMADELATLNIKELWGKLSEAEESKHRYLKKLINPLLEIDNGLFYKENPTHFDGF